MAKKGLIVTILLTNRHQSTPVDQEAMKVSIIRVKREQTQVEKGGNSAV